MTVRLSALFAQCRETFKSVPEPSPSTPVRYWPYVGVDCAISLHAADPAAEAGFVHLRYGIHSASMLGGGGVEWLSGKCALTSGNAQRQISVTIRQKLSEGLLKLPTGGYEIELFDQANSSVELFDPFDELGWVVSGVHQNHFVSVGFSTPSAVFPQPENRASITYHEAGTVDGFEFNRDVPGQPHSVAFPGFGFYFKVFVLDEFRNETSPSDFVVPRKNFSLAPPSQGSQMERPFSGQYRDTYALGWSKVKVNRALIFHTSDPLEADTDLAFANTSTPDHQLIRLSAPKRAVSVISAADVRTVFGLS